MAIGQAMPDAGAPVLGHELHQIATSLSTSMPVNRKLEEKRSSDARAWPLTQHGVKSSLGPVRRVESWALRGRHDAYRVLFLLLHSIYGELDFVQGTYPPLMHIERDVLC